MFVHLSPLQRDALAMRFLAYRGKEPEHALRTIVYRPSENDNGDWVVTATSEDFLVRAFTLTDAVLAAAHMIRNEFPTWGDECMEIGMVDLMGLADNAIHAASSAGYYHACPDEWHHTIYEHGNRALLRKHLGLQLDAMDELHIRQLEKLNADGGPIF